MKCNVMFCIVQCNLKYGALALTATGHKVTLSSTFHKVTQQSNDSEIRIFLGTIWKESIGFPVKDQAQN